MRSSKLYLIPILLLSACGTQAIPGPCSALQCGYNLGHNSIRRTALTYEISYGTDSFEIHGTYDVHFMDGSSTNGIPLEISGAYDDIIRSPQLTLTGRESNSPSSGELSGSVESLKKYRVVGMIRRPTSDAERATNLKALRIEVEESYVTSHVL